MYNKDPLNSYLEELSRLPVDDSVIKFLRAHQSEKYFSELLKHALDSILEIIQRIYSKYDDKAINSKEISTYVKAADFIFDDSLAYYSSVAAFFRGNKEKTIQYLKKANEIGFFGNKENPFTIDEFAVCFVAPFKGGFPGFWNEIQDMLPDMHLEKGCEELCKAVSLFYTSDNSLEIRAALEQVLSVAPNNCITKELLALNYYEDSLWGNAVAFFEQIESPILLFDNYMFFLMGWCYGKLHETKNEIKAYEKSADICEEGLYVLNNLGYAYYKAKQFTKALDCFQRCLDKGWDVKYAANNYVRTLLAMERFKDAKEFVKNAPVKIYKDVLEKVNNSESTNRRIASGKPLDDQFESEAREIISKKVDLGVKKQQFTSEKILEDEIVLRMEKGLPVFGINLKIYRRNGIYGRQYILPNGKRLDILAEDADGNLYIIELKKDSGYDDAYKQTTEYLEWFDENRKEKSKNIYSIICLNNPSEELINKVHKNSRMRVFEYQISYTER